MNRRTLISIHLYLASFFAPAILIMALSGLFYLMDIKGEVGESVVYQGQAESIDLKATDAKEQVEALLTRLNLDADFDYLRGSKTRAVTRPTSGAHYLISVESNNVTVTERSPSLIASIIELHKGHGPSWFRVFQQIMAVGLVIILVSGFLLGVTSPVLKKKSWVITGIGLASFLLLAII
ncbi:PepSY-associated TM helix domain-containing protein [Pleionea litopenaei]|uniref:PepSY-associated TM helix domain-containing protein n=1 Tax=Pleionea litopenaei TaxID=3070815 RepID=A0AA51RQ73_9GAMM|nr:PepSY-associated TM helix domain-containing protein [Pleionea sp. HL-JVS1]WMS85560.1 PepSY-associated TM helix domain-containing protein [Pleionea sp. HL-JVS1]